MASHIGKLPVTIPAGVEVKIDGQSFTAKGTNRKAEQGHDCPYRQARQQQLSQHVALSFFQVQPDEQ